MFDFEICLLISVFISIVIMIIVKISSKFKIKNYRKNFKHHIYNDVKTNNYRHACFNLIGNVVPESLRQTLSNLLPKHNNALLLQGFQFMFNLIENDFLPHNTHLEAVAAIFDSLTTILIEGDNFNFDHTNLTINNYQIIRIYKLNRIESIVFCDLTNNNEFTICYNRYEQSRLAFLFEEKRYQKVSEKHCPLIIKATKS